MTLSKCFKLSMTLLFVLMFCAACQNKEKEDVREYISLHEVKSLSEKGASLSWDDFDKYPFEDIGSGLYIRKYKIEGERQLLVRGRALITRLSKFPLLNQMVQNGSSHQRL